MVFIEPQDFIKTSTFTDL